ncbi:MAG: sterol carrier family protein, partial [Pseudonocardiaceae bacterium]
VETDPRTWLELATGRAVWAAAIADARVAASGARADLSAWLPLNADQAAWGYDVVSVWFRDGGV